MLKYKNKKGEEVEIEETEVITAIKEEYEKKLSEKDNEIKTLNDKHEKEKENLREEHVKQVRALLTGRKAESEKEEEEFEEEDNEEQLVKKAKEYVLKYNKGR